MPEIARASAPLACPGSTCSRRRDRLGDDSTMPRMFRPVRRDHWFIAFGWMGVDLFFALSGYLIAGQLLRPWARGRARSTRTSSPAGAAHAARLPRRCGPLFPVSDTAGVGSTSCPLWRFLTFTLNLGASPGGTTFSHAWSLCVEEQFYLAFPDRGGAAVARGQRRRRSFGAIGAGGRVGMALRGWLWLHDVAARRAPTSWRDPGGLHDADLLSDLVAARRLAGWRLRGADPGVQA